MRIFLICLLTWSQAFAAFPPTTLSGQSDTSKPTTFNFVTPYNQATIIGASTALYENGSNNLLKNPSFEATSGITSWTAGSGSVAADETTNIFAGKKSQLMTLTTVNGLSLSQDITPTIQMLGSNFEASVAIKTSLTTLQVCARQAAATYGTCATVQGDGNWHTYSVNMPGPSSGSVGVSVITTSSTTGTYYVDAGYVGLARNLGNGVPNNVFSAKISSAGVVSDENEDFINGNCTVSGTFTCNFVSGKFSVAPNCTLTDVTGSTYAGSIVSVSTSALVTNTFNTTNGLQTQIGQQIICTRSSTDWVQPTIQAPNWDTDWTSYTPNDGAGHVIGAVTTAPTPGAGYTLTAKWRRVGDSMEIMWNYFQTAAGSAGSGVYKFPLPTGYTIDTNKVTVSTAGIGAGGNVVGNGQASNTTALAANTANEGAIIPYDSNSLSFITSNGLTVGQRYPISSSQYSLASSVIYFSFTAKVPIQGWTKTLNAPMLVGSVTSNNTGAQLVSSVNVGGAGTNGTCTTTPCTLTSNDGFTSVTRSSTGSYTATLANTYSSPAKCVVSGLGNTAGNGLPFLYINNNGTTGSSFSISCFRPNLATVDDCSFSIICSGPR